MATRTFLAVPLSEQVVDRLADAQQSLSAAGARVRWVARENLHLTLKFLGNVEEADMAEVCRLAGEVAAAVEPFDFAVTALEAVPPRGALRMIWAGVAEPTGALAKLNRAAEDAYERMGFEKETRPYRPHLTLGRAKAGRNIAELRAAADRFAETDFGTTPAEELIVFESSLTPTGPIYSPLAKAAIGG